MISDEELNWIIKKGGMWVTGGVTKPAIYAGDLAAELLASRQTIDALTAEALRWREIAEYRKTVWDERDKTIETLQKKLDAANGQLRLANEQLEYYKHKLPNSILGSDMPFKREG